MEINLKEFTKNTKLMAENRLSAVIKSSTKQTYNLGDYMDLDGERFNLLRPVTITKGGDEELYAHKIDLESDGYLLLRKKIKLDGKLIFTVAGNLEFFLDLIISSMNEDYPTWTKGTIDVTEDMNLTFSRMDCRAAINMLATKFNVEYDMFNRIITMKSRIINNTGLVFKYGQDLGLYKLIRKPLGDKDTVTRVYGIGGSKNTTDGKELVLPEKYLEDLSLVNEVIEDVYVNADIYPSFEGEVHLVGDETTIGSDDIDFNLTDYINEGEEAKVVFTSGDLLGKEFAIKRGSWIDLTKQFDIIPVADEGGTVFPNATFKPQLFDKFTFIGIHLPTTYVDNAIIDLREATQEYLDQNKAVKVTYSLTIDHRFVTKHGIALKKGDVVKVIDTDLDVDRFIRIVSIVEKRIDDKLLSLTAEISDFVPVSSQQRLTASVIDANTEIEVVDKTLAERLRVDRYQQNVTRELIFDQDDYFDMGNIRPFSVEANMLSVGTVASDFLLKDAFFTDDDIHQLKVSATTLLHLQIERADQSYDWHLGSYIQNGLSLTSAYYLYAKCSKVSPAAIWHLTTSQLSSEDATDYYFLVGVLSPVADGKRFFQTFYGRTTIDGGVLRTNTVGAVSIITEELIVGDNITMGPNAVIQWGNVQDAPIGERNLILNSELIRAADNITLSSASVFSNDGIVFDNQPFYNQGLGYVEIRSEQIEVGEEYTISVDITAAVGQSLKISLNGPIYKNVIYTSATTNTFRYTDTWTATSTGILRIDLYSKDIFSTFSGVVKNIKLAKGGDSEWSLASEDVASTNRATIISEDTIKTTNVVAENLIVKSANIDGTLIASVIKTATTGKRVEINESGENDINVLDASGDKVVIIDDGATSGRIGVSAFIKVLGDNGYVLSSEDGFYSISKGETRVTSHGEGVASVIFGEVGLNASPSMRTAGIHGKARDVSDYAFAGFFDGKVAKITDYKEMTISNGTSSFIIDGYDWDKNFIINSIGTATHNVIQLPNNIAIGVTYKFYLIHTATKVARIYPSSGTIQWGTTRVSYLDLTRADPLTFIKTSNGWLAYN